MDTQNLAEAAQQMSMWDMVWSSDTDQGGHDRADCRFRLVMGDYYRKNRNLAAGEAAFPQFRVQILVRRVA